MGKYDVAMYEYMDDKERFADLVNVVLYEGEQIVLPQMLESDSERTGKRCRDLKKRLKNGDWLALVAVENQESIDYSMPFRMMEYDCVEYRKQLQQIKRERRRAIESTGDEVEMLEVLEEEEKEEYDMCKALDDLIEDGKAEGKVEGKAETLLAAIRSVMRSMTVAAERAMEILEIPEEERAEYLMKL